jgi:uncharacterized membrane protein
VVPPSKAGSTSTRPLGAWIFRASFNRFWTHTSTVTMSTPRARLESIDLVRGIIMILMALDHTRDFFGILGQNPTDLATTTVALFFTRWITHFCAPVFFLLTGTGAYLSLKTRTVPELSRYLWTRGLWLIVLEFTIVRCFAYQFNVDYRVTMLLVLWALGWSMIALAALVRLPVAWVTAIGALMIATHNMLDGVKLPPMLAVLHTPGFIVNSPTFTVFSAYPLIPWIGVTAVGFALGQIYEWEPLRRRAFSLRLGLGLSAAFVALRLLNVYGDPVRWTTQSRGTMTLVSFLNLNKYPPSLLFLLMTLGPVMLLLRAVDERTPSWLQPARTIGTVPLFYYVLHFALIHLIAVAVTYVQHGTAHWMFESPDLGHYPFSAPPGWGFSLAHVYIVWLGVVLIMYPFCRWFAGVKLRRDDVWLSYL